jgi:formyltetrahydrofolate deformylase
MTAVLEGRPTGNVTVEAGDVAGVRGTDTAQYVLTLACPERPGIVRAITAFLADRGFDIVEHQQFDDHISGKLYLRTAFTPGDKEVSAEGLSAEFAPSPMSSAWNSPSTTAAPSACW